MKKTKEIQKHLDRMREALDFFRGIQEDREQYHSERSEKWQESDKGEEYECHTQELEGHADDLENTIDGLESLYEDE